MQTELGFGNSRTLSWCLKIGWWCENVEIEGKVVVYDQNFNIHSSISSLNLMNASVTNLIPKFSN